MLTRLFLLISGFSESVYENADACAPPMSHPLSSQVPRISRQSAALGRDHELLEEGREDKGLRYVPFPQSGVKVLTRIQPRPRKGREVEAPDTTGTNFTSGEAF